MIHSGDRLRASVAVAFSFIHTYTFCYPLVYYIHNFTQHDQQHQNISYRPRTLLYTFSRGTSSVAQCDHDRSGCHPYATLGQDHLAKEKSQASAQT